MDARELLSTLHRQGFSLRPLPGEKLEIYPASKLSNELRQAIKNQKPELLQLLYQERWFLSRPLGQEQDVNAWTCWEPLMLWLLERHPDVYDTICDAEDIISRFEQKGVTSGLQYETACAKLFDVFETGRRLKMSAPVSI